MLFDLIFFDLIANNPAKVTKSIVYNWYFKILYSFVLVGLTFSTCILVKAMMEAY